MAFSRRKRDFGRRKRKLRPEVRAKKLKKAKRSTAWRSGPDRGIKRSRQKERSGTLNHKELMEFFETRIAKRGLPSNTPLEKISPKHKAAWIADCFKRSDAASFDPSSMKRIILPAALQNPAKFAEGLGKSSYRFFHGLGKHSELFFDKLAEKGQFQRFLNRTFRKGNIAYCDSKSLARGIAKRFDVFAEAMGEQEFNRFVIVLKRHNKTLDFFSGLKEVLGKEHRLYLLAREKILG